MTYRRAHLIEHLINLPRLHANVINTKERAAFAAIVEEELLSMHEGNFERFQVRSSEFAASRQVWADK